MRTIFSTLLGAVALVGATLPQQAQAHGYLVHSFPPRGDHITLPLKSAQLKFSIPADAKFSKVSIESENGVVLASQAQPRVSHNMKIAAPQLSPGKYRVRYRVLSPDGDILEGAVEFTADSR